MVVGVEPGSGSVGVGDGVRGSTVRAPRSSGRSRQAQPRPAHTIPDPSSLTSPSSAARPGSLLVRGVRIPSGEHPNGGPLSDVLVAAGLIREIAPTGSVDRRLLAAPAPVDVIEGRGRLLLPGLIDAHVHGEAAVFDPDVQLAMLRQGITTIVVGQDGVGFAPTAPAGDAFAFSTEYFRAINGAHPSFRGGSVAELKETYAGLPLNVEVLAPHGTIRYAVTGAEARPATEAEVAAMVALLEQALDDGAVGMSTGLEYVPAAYADEAELVALARVCAARGVPHVSHMRGYEEKAGRAFAELVRIARASGVATHVSHYHGPADELAGYVDDARASGLDVTFDSYPYLRGSSILSMVTLPTWLPIAEPDRTVALLQDPAVRERLRTEHFPGLADLWARVTMANVPGELRWTEGTSLLDVAARLGLDPEDTALELLVSTRLQAGCVFAQPPTNSAGSVRALANHEAQLAGSDAIYAGGRPHPRGWGAFARFASEHVGAGDWSWADAAEHLSARAARRFGLAGRGTVRVGAVADLALVDPATVRDLATYEGPRTPAQGVDDVVVGGRHVLAGGALVDGRPTRPPTEQETA
ncbi:amidohydrolase family protein [Luteimicrobium xylanilyticum]|uniref:N-acyl-D-amino-acid deacylase n=1 Tax=Luteimicrobium xylanilyticum TaxID=1133546 RepID=A0A5P9QDP0_9MICO|nr:N-acyl-D-amino-acid deacylase [Luteimicrobium xylanilyticum]